MGSLGYLRVVGCPDDDVAIDAIVGTASSAGCVTNRSSCVLLGKQRCDDMRKIGQECVGFSVDDVEGIVMYNRSAFACDGGDNESASSVGTAETYVLAFDNTTSHCLFYACESDEYGADWHTCNATRDFPGGLDHQHDDLYDKIETQSMTAHPELCQWPAYNTYTCDAAHYATQGEMTTVFARDSGGCGCA
eukprot:g4392.t1